jgi:hypothetical protein
MFTFLHLHFVTYVLVRYFESYGVYLVSFLYHVTYLVLAHKVVLPCLTPISYVLCFICVLTLHVLSYEYTLLAWST